MTYEEADAWWREHGNGRIEFGTRLRDDYDPKNDRGDQDFEWRWDATAFRGMTMFVAWDQTFMGAVSKIKSKLDSYPAHVDGVYLVNCQ